MIMLERTIRLTAASIGLCAALGSPVARANSGLELKLLDGSIAVNQPDLFATAYSKAWGNGSQFCAALQSIIAQTGNKNGSVSSCQASPYGNTGVVSAGSLAAHLEFTAMVTLQGSAPFYQKTCAFVDTINLIAQDTLSISETASAPKDTLVSLAPPVVKGLVTGELWSAPCSNAAGNHPMGIADLAASWVQTAASDIGFPGNALVDALQPYQNTIARDLNSMVYTVATQTGDVVIDVTNSFLHQRLEQSALKEEGGAATAQAAPGTWGAPPSAGATASNTKWGVPGNTTVHSAVPASPIGAVGTASRATMSSLNPQPLPPKVNATNDASNAGDAVSLNPQPLPPKIGTQAVAGTQN